MRTARNLVAAVVGAATAALVAAPSPAMAQSESDAVAYVALIATPQGGFAPIVTPAMLGRPTVNPALALRYGRVDLFDDAANNLALTALLPAGPRGAVSVTAGYWNPDCADCDGHLVLGLGGESRLSSSPLGEGPQVAQLNVGLNGEVGFAKPEGVTFWSATVGVPVTLVAPGQGFRLAPFLTPGFGFGRASGGGTSEAGTRFMLGGGIGFDGDDTFGATVGFQKVFIDGGETTIGLNVSFRL